MTVETSDWFLREVYVHDALIKRYLQRCGLQPADIDDICQEMYRRFLEMPPEARPESGRAFALTAARNLRFDRFRTSWSRLIRLDVDPGRLAEPVELDPERYALADMELKGLQQAIDTLTPRRRQVLWMRRVEQRSLKEIGQLLKISSQTVAQHLTRALTKLRRCAQYG